MTKLWWLTYSHGGDVVELGWVNDDWLTGFSQRMFDQGATFETSPLGQHHLVLEPGRHYTMSINQPVGDTL